MVCTEGNHTAMKSEDTSFAAIMLSKVSQTQRDRYCMLLSDAEWELTIYVFYMKIEGGLGRQEGAGVGDSEQESNRSMIIKTYFV